MLLVLMNGFFVAAEFAMVKARDSRIDTLIMEGNKRAKYAKEMIDHLDDYLSACQLGITLASLGLGWIGEPAVAKLIEPALVGMGFSDMAVHTVAFAVSFSIITALHIVIGELAPKSLAIQKAESLTLFTAGPMILFHKVMYPIIWFLNKVASLALKSAGLSVSSESHAAHTEEEIRILMKESHRQGYIDQEELDYVDNIFDFADRNAREVMIPRTDMICLYVQDTFRESVDTAIAEQLTRYPVCDPDKDNIIGFVHIKDILGALGRGEEPDIRTFVRDMLAVPESMPLSDLLKLMQKNRAQIALVVDEYGGTAGLVTVEDIIEEIVGEIQDEFDVEERKEVERRAEGNYSVDGLFLIDEVNELVGTHLDSETFDTIGGWMYAEIGETPTVGRTIETENCTFTVEETDDMRITRVGIVKHEDPTEEEQEE